MTLTATPRLPREQYDAIKAWNCSLLKLALDRTPAHAYAAYLDPNRPERESNAAFDIGSMLHDAILEPEGMGRLFCCVPDDAPRKPTSAQLNAKKPSDAAIEAIQWWDAFVAANADRTILSAKDYALARSLERSLLDHPVLRSVFRATSSEQEAALRDLNELTLQWIDPVTSQPCKARIDAVRFHADHIRVHDLKSCADAGAEAFGKASFSYGYLLQGMFYSDAVFYCREAIARIAGFDPADIQDLPIVFEFDAIEKAYPFMTARYVISPEQGELGRSLYRRAMEMVTTAAKLNYWPGYDTAPVPIELPGWATAKLSDLVGAAQ
jgi:exodeoxyribonuclease VIII